MRVQPPENGGSPGARLPAQKWGIRRCAFARQKTEDPLVHVARPKMDDPQVRVRPPENEGSAGARRPAQKWRIRRCTFDARK